MLNQLCQPQHDGGVPTCFGREKRRGGEKRRERERGKRIRIPFKRNFAGRRIEIQKGQQTIGRIRSGAGEG